MPDFSGLQIGLSALIAQRRALDVTGNNLANVGTDGYSRQRVTMASDSGPLKPAVYSTWTGGGMGVQSGNISRLRDQFLEVRGYQEHSQFNRVQQQQSALERVESAFGEPSDTGLGAQLADFWAGWDDVANRPDDLAARSQLLERATTLTDGIRHTGGDLDALRGTTIDQMGAVVQEVNSLAARIADLNKSIQGAIGSQLSPNDLMDQRDLLIGQLADRVGATIRPGEFGTTDVFVGGTSLVHGTVSEKLELAVDPGPAQTAVVRWVKDGLPASTSGSVAGMLDTVNDIIPRYRQQLDAVATQVLTTVNGAHSGGFDLDGNAGLAFFQMGPTGLVVNPTIAGDPRKVAAAGTAGTLDGSVASAIAGMTGPDVAYRSLVASLGVEAQSTNRRVDIQQAIVTQVDSAREATSGVSIDEEMTNLIAYQHAYDAAARFVKTVDETLESLIGMVG